MKTLALDASSTSVGFVVGDTDIVTAHGTLHLKGDLAARIVQMHGVMCDLIEEHQPRRVLMERPAGAHKSSLIAQANAQGIIKYVCALRDVPLVEISAAAGKKALTGKGNANKEKMVEAAALYLAGDYDQHSADALGLLKAATA